MPIQIPDGFGQAAFRLKHASDPDPWIVTLGFFAQSFAPDAEDFVLAAAQSWNDHLKSQTSTNVTLTDVQAVFNDGGVMKATATHPNIAGTGSATQLPQNCALLVRKTTGLVGRKFQGRMYWPGMLVEGNVSDVGIISTTELTNMSTHFDDFFDDLVIGSSFAPVLLHSDNTAPTQILGFAVSSLIATQRRRLR